MVCLSLSSSPLFTSCLVQLGHYWWADKFPIPHHLALQRLWCIIHEEAALWTHRDWNGGFGVLDICVCTHVCVYVCVGEGVLSSWKKTCSLLPSPRTSPLTTTSTITTKSNTNWMLNKPVSWIIEDLRPEQAPISIQALWIQSAPWQDFPSFFFFCLDFL